MAIRQHVPDERRCRNVHTPVAPQALSSATRLRQTANETLTII